ncbi:MAG: flagellar basal body protein FliL [Methylococcaceae bacterium]|nr:flagellar basal body protein FliL [Methylococcaceae bacterium]
MAQAEKLDLGEEKASPSSSKSLIIIVLAAVLVTLAAVFGTLYFLGIFPPKHAAPAAEHAAEAPKPEPPVEQPLIYEPLAPAFVVNFSGNPEVRVVQIEITAAAREKEILDALKKHMPILRNNVLMLISGQDPLSFKTAEGKEALRAKLKEEMNKIVAEQTGKKNAALDEIYFTGFVMQ